MNSSDVTDASEQLHPPRNEPQTETELLARCSMIAGMTLGELAKLAKVKIPKDFKRHKGWAGQLIELWLGAEAGSKPTQDFQHLGIELKTIPVDQKGVPLETTYVCYCPLQGLQGLNWLNSNVFNKLQRVLWLPVQGSRDIAPADRIIGNGFLWSPNTYQIDVLRNDWEELMEAIVLGNVAQITARMGDALHLRPKAASGQITTEAIGNSGTLIQTRPRGFYLRKSFTKHILQQHFGTF